MTITKNHTNMNCLFCDIVKGKIPAKVIAQNDLAIAFLDINPLSDGHTIVIPKEHFKDFMSCSKEALCAVNSLAQEVQKILDASKLRPWGFNILSNQGSIAGQEIFHFHIHVIPKYFKNEGLIMSGENINVKNVDDILEIISKTKKPNKKTHK